jgi:adenylate kinase family enzyme
MRIHVTGNAASGKTTLAARLGAELGLPVFSLDSVVWQPGWRKTPPDQRLAAEQKLVALPGWVIDGVSPLVRASADRVIFLDVSPHVCAWRGILRALRYFRRTRPGLPEPCPDVEIIPRLLRLIYRFPSRAGAEIREESARQPHRFRTESRSVNVAALVRDLRG